MNVLPPSVTCDPDFGFGASTSLRDDDARRRARGGRTLAPISHPLPRFAGWWTALDANTATWHYQSVKQDFFGPANYTDDLTIKKSSPVRGQ